MTSAQYLADLRLALKGVPQKEAQDCIEYFTELFAEADPAEQESLVARLGKPRQVAAQLRADAAVRHMDEKPVSPGNGLRTLWLVLASIFAAPIALPIAIAGFAVAFALLISLLAVLISLFAVTISIAASGLFMVVVSLFAFPLHTPTALLFMGCGLVAAALGCIMTVGLWKLSALTLRGLSRGINKKQISRRAEA